MAALCCSAGAIPAVDAVVLVSGLGFVLAGAALLIGWKLNGWACCAWLGVAAVDLGVMSIVQHSIFGSAGDRFGFAYSLGSILVTVIVAGLVDASVRAPEVDSGLRPLRMLGLTLAAGLVGLVVLGRLASSIGGGVELARAMSTGCALIWWEIAYYALSRRAAPSRRDVSRVVAAISLLMSAAGAVDIVVSASASDALWPWMCGLAAAAAALLMSVYLLRRVLDGQDRYQLGLRMDLDLTRDRSERDRAVLDERLHDLRNAVTAVRAADAALRRCQADLDPQTGEQLADAITAELCRLQTLVEPERPLEIAEVALREALAPVIALARASDMRLDVDMGSDLVLGDAEATARIVQNLLVNARLHAPGSPVSVVSRRVRDKVELRISDLGRGVPERERASLFERGFRGRDSIGTDGSGVGLFVASKLASDMRGRLRLDPSGPGATFVLELPACSAN
jgi:signal transduction histidine kinase